MCELDYDKIAPIVGYSGICFQCSREFSGRYPLQLRTARGDPSVIYFCSYACLRNYTVLLEAR